MSEPRVLNYTTSIDPKKTIAELTEILLNHKASEISTRFDAKKRPVAITFTLINVAGTEDHYRLDVKVDQVLARLQKQPGIPPRYRNEDQALRTGWRTIKVWLAAQLDMIALDIVKFDEVMMAYQLRGQQTLYEWVIEQKQLGAPK